MDEEFKKQFELFSGSASGIESWLRGDNHPKIIAHLSNLADEPLTRSRLNQLLALAQEAPLSEGFYRYYWLHLPKAHAHPYKVESIEGFEVDYPDRKAIQSLAHFRWGLYRLYVDALLFFGNVRHAYQSLRVYTFEELESFYTTRCFDYDSRAGLLNRGAALALNNIPKDDRYLISEMACKSYDPGSNSGLWDALEGSFKSLPKQKNKKYSVKEIIAGAALPERQMEFEFSASEFLDLQVGSLAALKKSHGAHKARFDAAREMALENTEIYLSAVNELDAYVATSMRNRDDFRKMATNCEAIFNHAILKPLNLRYFDPTLSAAPGHVDKGLIECLMVKCAKLLVYMAGEKESWGKDAEAAMALSLGKPVIFLCDEEGKSRFYKEVHPLSRLIDFTTGVAVGVYVTSKPDHVPVLIHRILSNSMEYDLVRASDNGDLQLKDRLTESVVRVQTGNRLLRETFWNHYHNRV